MTTSPDSLTVGETTSTDQQEALRLSLGKTGFFSIEVLAAATQDDLIGMQTIASDREHHLKNAPID